MRRIVTFFVLAALLPLAACGDGPTVPAVDVTGVWELRTINDLPLPVIVASVGEDTQEVLEGTITLNADGSFEDRALLRTTIDGEIFTNEDLIVGTWTQSGGALTLTEEGGGRYFANVAGGELTQTFNNIRLVYTQ